MATLEDLEQRIEELELAMLSHRANLVREEWRGDEDALRLAAEHIQTRYLEGYTHKQLLAEKLLEAANEHIAAAASGIDRRAIIEQCISERHAEVAYEAHFEAKKKRRQEKQERRHREIMLVDELAAAQAGEVEKEVNGANPIE